MAIAQRCFSKKGNAKQYRLGLAYVREELHRRSPPAVLLVGAELPLDIAAEQNCLDILIHAAELGSLQAARKMGTWHLTCVESRALGLSVLRDAGLADALEGLDANDPKSLAQFLRRRQGVDFLNGAAVAIAAAREHISASDWESAAHCIAVAFELDPPLSTVSEVVVALLLSREAATATACLPPRSIESAVRYRAERGDAKAQYILGCWLAGMEEFGFGPQQAGRKGDARASVAWLLRAADAGMTASWLRLASVSPAIAGNASGRQLARFFLEKASAAREPRAQMLLGIALMKEAKSLTEAEQGVQLLNEAAIAGEVQAQSLLETMVLPIAEMSDESQSEAIEKVMRIESNLGAHLRLARALHLTRREALSAQARDFREWGLVLPGTSKESPGGRIAPAVNPEMRIALHRISGLFDIKKDDGLSPLQRFRIQRRVFSELGISENTFFAAECGRAKKTWGYGKAWAVQASNILCEIEGVY